MEQSREYVIRTVEERRIRFIRLWFTDVVGHLKNFTITPAELEVALEEGMRFDGSTIEGWSRVQEADMLAIPDPRTFEIQPWGEGDMRVARIFCDITYLDGTPFAGDPRAVLKRNLEIAHERGFTFFAGPEIEYFYFNSSVSPEPIDNDGYFDMAAMDGISGVRQETVLALEAMGIPVEYSFHENGPSQHEIDLRYTDALTMADGVMTARYVIKKIASQHGIFASFMPKPLGDAWGSGMHTHFSLYEGEVNAFSDPGDEYGLSKTAKAFIAGVLHHAREISAVTNQWVNSYKRLTTGYEAPLYACWARNNQSALVRVPMPKRGQAAPSRVELRSPDPACNPYLAFAVVLAAGMRGITEGYDLPPEATNDIFEMTKAERGALGIVRLPTNLDAAIDEMEQSELVREALGERVVEFLVRNKRREWNEYIHHVTPFEIEKYLGAL